MVITGISNIDRHDLRIFLTAIDHIHTANDSAVDIAAREGGHRGQDQNIQRVSVKAKGFLHEAVFRRIKRRRIQHTIQLDFSSALVHLIFVLTAHRNLNPCFYNPHSARLLSILIIIPIFQFFCKYSRRFMEHFTSLQRNFISSVKFPKSPR